MKRILVIQDDALWLDLNRHLAGNPEVRLSETPSLSLGLRLAQVEAPDLIVCRAGDGDRSPEELAKRFRSREIDLDRVVFVRDGRVGIASNTESPGLRLCRPERFLETVDRLLASSKQKSGPPQLALLAHYQLVTAQPGEPQRGFVNVLEITPSKLLLEASEPVQEGDRMSLNFLLPQATSSGEAADRVAVALICEIQSCKDESKLHYWAKTMKVKHPPQARLEQFIRTHLEREGSL